MKNLLLLAFTVVLLFSCTEVETNTPAFEGSIDNVHFRATDSRTVLNEDGTFSIEGVTVNNIMNLRISSSNEGTYLIDETSNNQATVQNSLGIIYTTEDPEATGEIIITNSDPTTNLVSGKFRFTAMVPGVDTLRVHDGIFYQVPYYGISDDEDDDESDLGTLMADVDGDSFISSTVTALDAGNLLTIIGSNNTSAISLKMPNNVEIGSYNITEDNFSAGYTSGDIEEEGITGAIFIIDNDVVAKTISGTFIFVTENHSIEQGEFNVSY